MAITDVILIVTMLGVTVFGYFLMKHLDKFLDANRRQTDDASGRRSRTAVMLTADLSDEALVERIRTYQAQNGDVRIVLCPDSDDENCGQYDGER